MTADNSINITQDDHIQEDYMQEDYTQEDYAQRIMVALDYSDEQEARILLTKLQGIPCYMKVGLQLFYAAGPRFIVYLKEQGYKVFLDVKMHDIPNTVKGGSESVTRLGVDMFNVHAAGGRRMMEAALEGVDKAAANSQIRPLVIGVTQLTSTDQEMLNSEIGIPGEMEEAVLRYATLAAASGLDGVVASPWEVSQIKAAIRPSFITVTPGIRPLGTDIGDQARIMTPQQAFAQGSEFIVIGRPITASPNPRAALEQIIKELV